MTVVLVEQDPEILSAFCDRITLLHEGRIELVAPPTSFYAERSLLERCGVSVGELARISWRTGYTYESRPPLTLEEGEAAFAPTLARHTPATQREPLASPTQDPVMRAENVWYQYDDGTTALRGVDLTVYSGEMLVLLGLNGSGKTTFAKIVAGLYRPSRGHVQVLGQNLASRRVRRSLPRRVGYVFQNPDHQIFQRTVKDEVEYGLKNLGIDPAQRQQMVAATLSAVNLTEYADEDPLFLSKGQRQRLAVAAVLAMGPEILIVDEPTTGQDARSVASIMTLLCELRQKGKTIIIITHDMTLVAAYCQRVVAFRDGQVAFTGLPAQLFEHQDLLKKTGLHPPTAAALATRLRAHYPNLPSLLTVEQWSAFLGTKQDDIEDDR